MSVRFLGPDTDAYVASVERHAAEFEQQTGETLEITIVPSDLYFSNEIHHLLAGEGAADVYMSGPVLMWEHLAAGFVQPLDEFFEHASAEYDAGDFVERLLRCNRWSGRFGDPLGSGPLLEIPVNCESYNLSYVPATLAAYELEVPRTWEDYFSVARALTERSGGSVRGFAQRGTTAWHTIYTGFATQFWSYGATDFKHGRCALGSPTSVEATSRFLSALRESGPADWLEQHWYELALDFAHGRYGMIVDSDHYVAFFEDPELSDHVGRIAYAPPPSGPSGLRKPNLWTWSVVMNSHSVDKHAAWSLIEWATSKQFLLRSVFEGNMNPTRTSIWDDERFREHVRPWGAFSDVARNLIEHEAEVLVTPAPNYLRIAMRWVEALREAFEGRASVEAALAAAAADIDALVAATHVPPQVA